jgi:flagellar motor switch protein FliN/FliY
MSQNPGNPGGAGDLAAAALKAAQDAVSNLRQDSATSPPPAPVVDAGQDALAAAQAAIAAAKAVNSAAAPPLGVGAGTPPAQPFTMPSFTPQPAQAKPEGIDLLADVNLNVKIELGRTRMLVEDVLRLGEGSVVELDKLAGDPVDVYVNDRHVARGEVLVLNDNFCVRINEIVANLGEQPAR